MDGVGGHIDNADIVAALGGVAAASSTRPPHGPQHGTPPQHWSGTP
jgi:hypothetical protein